MQSLTHKIEFSIAFGDEIALSYSELDKYKNELNQRGVYLLLQGKPMVGTPVHLGLNVFYIGKAVSETIFSRARKHVDSITKAVNGADKPKTRPGKRFKAFREKIACKLDDLFLVPGYMVNSMSFEVSCAEEWLLWTFTEKNSAIPVANTFAAKNINPRICGVPC